MNSRLGVKSLKSAWFSTFCLGFDNPFIKLNLPICRFQKGGGTVFPMSCWIWSNQLVNQFVFLFHPVECCSLLFHFLVTKVWQNNKKNTSKNKTITKKKLRPSQPIAACAVWSDRQLPRHLPYSCPSGPGWKWGSHRSADADPLSPWIPRSSWVTWQWWLEGFNGFRDCRVFGSRMYDVRTAGSI